MKKSFKDADAAIEVDEPVATLSPEAAPPPPVSDSKAIVPDTFFSNEDVEGEYHSRDIQIPRFNLAQAVGPLSAIVDEKTKKPLFPPGDFVYNRERNLGPGPIEITLLKLKKTFVEDLPYSEDGPKPRVVMTENDIRKLGAFPIWEKKERGDDEVYFKPSLDALLLIKGSADFEDFDLLHDGNAYAKAVWTLQSTAYRVAGKTFITAATGILRAGIHTAPFLVKSSREKVGANWVQVPHVRIGKKHDEAFVAFAASQK